jgi:hypothetical protein
MMSLDRPDALFVAADAFFTSRRVQLISLARAMRFPPSTRFCAAQSRAKFLSSSQRSSTSSSILRLPRLSG